MRRTVLFPALVALLGAAGACGGGGIIEGPAGSASRERIATDDGTILSQSLGSVDVTTFGTAMEKVLIGRYRFSLRRREEQYQSLYYETLWVPRPPADEEREAGVLGARHRIVIQGRRASSGALPGSAVLYRMTIRVENQARTALNQDWHPAAALGGTVETDMRRMVSDLHLEVRAGRSR